MSRLTTAFKVKALIRRVHDAGGSAMVLARGDATAGAMLVVAQDRDDAVRFYERGFGPGGAATLIESGPQDSDAESSDAYCARRRARDPDLWIIELRIASAEQFAAETMLVD